ncbi:hypothetical protein SAMN05444851_0128 [Aliiroseovarius sediminilitoris]|uniref:Ferrochelatase n=1 Tax=Aliiroseovarius sediminilitoris TaxID=1173584 RepID=A0A1I0MMC8_9RHOB|nr:hypothetical protein [Aliiroseovarius sediminilitoris]SEV89050.1 hypothetical protein SAMN05444851_0128 [Aliiroseovarius sediminilitoris]
MKKVMTLAAAGMIALSAPAFAGAYGDAVVEEEVVVVEEAGSSLGNTGLALLGLAVVAGIIAASDDDTAATSTN